MAGIPKGKGMTDIQYNPDELFQLADGRYVTTPEVSEKMRIIKEARPEAPHADSTGYSWDENGMADLFAECYENDTRYCTEAKSWYTYADGRWQKDIGALLVAAKIKEFVRLMALYCGEIRDDEIRKRYMTFVTKMGDRRFRDRIMKDAASNLIIPAAEFDKDPCLINCKNGTWDLRTGELHEHTWQDFLTMQSNFSASLQPVTCPRWTQFIQEITEGDKEKADYLQRALGYSILGKSNEECMFILYGKTTRNGKSTLLNTIQHLLGDYATVAPVELICRSDRTRNAENATSTLANLKGRRFVTMAESDTSGKLDESVIKQYTGGEEITARRLYENSITFMPQFTIWLSCNDLPAVRDKSLFASDRVRVIEFNRHFSDEEQDKNLKNYFESDIAMEGIFAWLVRGYNRYVSFGLAMPESMQPVMKAYAKDNDIVLQFLEDRCEVVPEERIRAKNLYDTYKSWCRSNGYFVCSLKHFIAEVTTHPEWYTRKGLSHGAVAFEGIKLKEV